MTNFEIPNCQRTFLDSMHVSGLPAFWQTSTTDSKYVSFFCEDFYFALSALKLNARSLLIGGGVNPFSPVKPRAKIINYFNASNYF